MKVKKIPCGCGCGAEIPEHDKRGRRRRFVRGHSSRVTKPEVKRQCKGCGKTFSMKKRGQWYCSDKCHYPNIFCACGCGKKLAKKSRLAKAKYIQGHHWLGKKHTKEQIEKIRGTMKCEREGVHGTGGSYKIYGYEFRKIKKVVADRFGNRCALCSCSPSTRKHHVHHIDGDKRNHNWGNLILLCHACHRRVHGKSAKISAEDLREISSGVWSIVA